MILLMVSALCGLMGASGALQLLSVFRKYRPTLAMRVQYGSASSGTSHIGWRLRETVKTVCVSAASSLGSSSAAIERRLQLLGKRESNIAHFRFQQFIAGITAMGMAGFFSTLLIINTKNGTIIPCLLTCVGGILGVLTWDKVLGIRAKARQRAIERQIPDITDLLALSIGAGESIPSALARISDIAHCEVGDELSLAAHAIHVGTPLCEAISDLSDRNDSISLNRLCTTLITAVQRGTPLARTLHDQARDLRDSTRHRLLEEGGKREIAMLVPVVFLILPVTILFALYPGIISFTITP